MKNRQETPTSFSTKEKASIAAAKAIINEGMVCTKQTLSELEDLISPGKDTCHSSTGISAASKGETVADPLAQESPLKGYVQCSSIQR